MLKKCFLDEFLTDKLEYSYGSCFKNEIFHFGLCFKQKEDSKAWKKSAYLSVKSDISQYIHISRVEVVPVQQAVANSTEDYLRVTLGLYSDVMQPLENDGRREFSNNLKSLMIEVDTKGKVSAGKYPITFDFMQEDCSENICSASFGRLYR